MSDRYETLNAQEVMEEANKFVYEEWMYENGIGIYGGKLPNQAERPYSPAFTKAQIKNPDNDTD